MTGTQLDIIEDELNPLDHVEDVLNANEWTFNRMNEEELTVQITGKTGQYRLFFIWQENMNALQFCCQYNVHIQPNNQAAALSTITNINEGLWMGHFDLPKDTGTPTFRYTCLFRGLGRGVVNEMIEDMVDIALAQCERHAPVFSLLASANDVNDQMMSLALMETAGES